MGEWRRAPIADTAIRAGDALVDGPFGSNLKAEEYVESGVRLVQLQNVGQGFWIDRAANYISEEKADTLRRHQGRPGDIAIAKMAEPVARACRLPDHEKKFVVVADCIRLRVDEDQFDPRFVTYAINSAETRSEAEAAATGSTRVRINLAQLKRVSIAAPPLEEQRRIAEILDTIDETIQATERVIAKRTVLADGLRNAMVDKLFGVALAEPLDRLIRIIDCKHYTPRYRASGYPVVRPRNIKPGRLDFGDIEFVCESDFAILTGSHRPRRGDIALSRNASFGAAALVDFDEPFAIGQDVVVLTPTSSNSKYIEACLRSDRVQRQIAAVSGGSTFGRINLGDIRQLRIPAAGSKEQQEVSGATSAAERAVAVEEAYLNQLRKLRTGLAADLLSGRVRTVAA